MYSDSRSFVALISLLGPNNKIRCRSVVELASLLATKPHRRADEAAADRRSTRVNAVSGIPSKVTGRVPKPGETQGEAILIFTRDEKFFDEIWRPSENVVHELGATSFAYSDRIVIFKEKGLHFPLTFRVLVILNSNLVT